MKTCDGNIELLSGKFTTRSRRLCWLTRAIFLTKSAFVPCITCIPYCIAFCFLSALCQWRASHPAQLITTAPDAYVWPRCRRITKSLHSVPGKHLKVFQQFLAEYSGICNFNYKALITFLLHQSAASSLFLDTIWHIEHLGVASAGPGDR